MGELGKPLSIRCHLYLGIALIAITPPPPHSNGHSGALFFRRDFTILPFLPFCLPFSLNKCPKPSGQGFRPPQNQANARLNLENSSLKKCPKPSGQGFRLPPPNGQCPNRGGDLLKGASLKSASIVSCFERIVQQDAYFGFQQHENNVQLCGALSITCSIQRRCLA